MGGGGGGGGVVQLFMVFVQSFKMLARGDERRALNYFIRCACLRKWFNAWNALFVARARVALADWKPWKARLEGRFMCARVFAAPRHVNVTAPQRY